jgi:LysR family transcriptional regulator, regulator for bpeEF and oprC
MEHLGQIAAFVRVVEAKSFAAAAQTMGVTPSGISKSVARLEQRLGVRLLNRTTRSLSLTDAGATFFNRCRDALRSVDEAEDALASERGKPRGRLRIDMPLAIGRAFVIPALPRFMVKYPDIDLQLSMTDRLVDMDEEGIDIVVRVGALKDSSLVARELWEPRIQLCASPDYLRRRGTPLVPEDVLQHECVNFFNPNTGQLMEWTFEKGTERRSILAPGRLAFNNGEAVVDAVIAGAGLGMAFGPLLERSAAAGLVQPILGDWVQGSRKMWALYRKERQSSPKIRAFVDFLVGLFPQENRRNKTK